MHNPEPVLLSFFFVWLYERLPFVSSRTMHAWHHCKYGSFLPHFHFFLSRSPWVCTEISSFVEVVSNCQRLLTCVFSRNFVTAQIKKSKLNRQAFVSVLWYSGHIPLPGVIALFVLLLMVHVLPPSLSVALKILLLLVFLVSGKYYIFWVDKLFGTWILTGLPVSYSHFERLSLKDHSKRLPTGGINFSSVLFLILWFSVFIVVVRTQ